MNFEEASDFYQGLFFCDIGIVYLLLLMQKKNKDDINHPRNIYYHVFY